MIWLLFPRFQREVRFAEKLDELQHELEKRVERLDGTKSKLISHANGALHAAPIGEVKQEKE
jgi:hypothetical protein